VTRHARLSELLAEHEADRDADGPASVRRRAEVMRLHLAREFVVAGDQLAAAAVLLGSSLAAEVEAAHSLALAAMAAEPGARSVAATAFDRLRMLAGKPQKFGTQVTARDGQRVLWPVDATTTDSERAKWGLPALAELQRRVGMR
jgi:hypothetical protein